MRSALTDRLSRALDLLRKENRFRDPRRLSAAPGARTAIDGRTVVNFASNNYLDLAGHPAVAEAAARGVREWGAGATASRLMGGT
ncbi:MAG TPA: 8-amino-7-oxononanoate synthase, partial [Elusimicrobiota bacterium]|nr:8-amino-7-oxononanoate synthase [Elusimicrobiota bacterium]